MGDRSTSLRVKGFVLKTVEETRPVATLEELDRHLELLAAKDDADFSLVRLAPPMKGFERFLYRVLGLATEMPAMTLAVRLNVDGAVVDLLDQDYNELVAGRVVSRDQAFEMTRSFFQDGRPPQD